VPALDVLINNAGISLDTGASVTETDVEAFRRTYETNVFGVVAVTNAFLPALRAAGTGSGAAYRSSKTALNALTVFYAQALAGEGVRVNALAPGLRATNLNPRASQAGGDRAVVNPRRSAPFSTLSGGSPEARAPGGYSAGVGSRLRATELMQ
jgi:NAD(P)-dependent dehydrogenase (short-subunit alcohol dehydrogenase family)